MTDSNGFLAALLSAEERPTVPIWPDTCVALGISRSTGYSAVKRGEIPVIKIGSRFLVPTAWLRRTLHLDEPEPSRLVTPAEGPLTIQRT